MECVLFFEAMSTATCVRSAWRRMGAVWVDAALVAVYATPMCVVRQWVSPLNGVLPDGKTAITRRSAWE
jgi:hypothetical protein